MMGRDDATYRRAAVFAGADVAAALIAMAVLIGVGLRGYVLVAVPAVLLLAGGLAAFVRTYQVWRRGGAWPIWHGAGWVLFVLFLVYSTIATGSLVRT